MPPPRHYFDHNATTPVDPAVRAALVAAFDRFGNPSSLHMEGQAARALVDQARGAVARSLGARRDEIYFTSGGTESDNWAMLSGVRVRDGAPRRVLISSIEHPAVLAAGKRLAAEGFEVVEFGVASDGTADLNDLETKMAGGAALVALMLANNETGVIQPVREAAAIAHRGGALLFCDAVQAWGKIPVVVNELGADLLAVTAHKAYGPKGVGALWVKKGLDLAPIHVGGGQEGRRRGGTEAVPMLAALSAVAERIPALLDGQSRMQELRDRLEARLAAALGELMQVNGSAATRLAGTSSLAFDGVAGEALLINLDLEGFAVSTGAACSSGQLMPSHVLSAMGIAEGRVRGSLRISIGESNEQDDVDALAAALEKMVPALRKIGI